MVATLSKIEKELQEATSCKPKSGQDRQEYLGRMSDAVQRIEDPDWEKLSEPAQEWANAAANALKHDKDFPDFEEVASDDAGDEEQEEQVTENEDETEKETETEEEAEEEAPKKKSTPKKKTSAKSGNPAATKEKESKKAPAKEKPEKEKKSGRPLAEGKVEGIKFEIKKAIVKDTKISVDDLCKQLGGKVSKVTVSNVRADFRHSLRVLNQLGKLTGVKL